MNLDELDQGNTPIDPDEMAGLIPDISLKQELNEYERKNILEAHKWAMHPRRLRFRDPLTESYLRDLHRRMFDETWKWAGRYRETEKQIGVLVHEIRNRIPVLLGDARYWLDHETYPPDEIAVRVTHGLVWIHPFPNGNGRHARLLADVIAVRSGRTEFTWGRDSIQGVGPTRKAYLNALRTADAGNLQEIMDFARS